MCNPLPRALHGTVGIRSASKLPMRASDSLRTAVSLLSTRALKNGVRMKGRVKGWVQSVESISLHLSAAPSRTSVQKIGRHSQPWQGRWAYAYSAS